MERFQAPVVLKVPQVTLMYNPVWGSPGSVTTAEI